MKRNSLLVRLGFAAVLAAVVGSPAQAGIIPVSVTVLPESGNFRWTYAIVLPSNMKIQSGDYFTIYDFAGYKPGSAMVDATGPDASFAANWGFASTNTGLTPDRLSPDDSASLPNLTWTYNGPAINIDAQVSLGNFSATSSFEEEGTSFLTGRNSRSVDGVIVSTITPTVVPVGTDAGPGVPEPTTLALAGLGLPIVGLRRYLRRKQAA